MSRFPPNGGEVGALMRSFDWTGTDLGPPEGWSQSLKGYVSMILDMPTPAIIFWGPNQTQLYNDGYAVILGPRHPTYLAASYEACWPDTYPVIYPWMQKVLAGGVWQVQDQLFVLTRHGFTEEAYFTFTFSPLRDDDGKINGIFQPVVEVTDAVLEARRSEVLRRLTALVDAPHPREAATVLADSRIDLPVSLLYLQSDRDAQLELAVHASLDGVELSELRGAPIDQIVRRVFESGRAEDIGDLDVALGHEHVGYWPEPTQRACVVPLMRSATDPPRGVAVLGLSPRLRFDTTYRKFVDAVARQLAANIAAHQAKRIERDLLTREREARKAAELQEEHLQGLLEQAPTPMVVLRGPALVVELANPHACRLWMREPQQVIGKPLFEALPEIRDQVFEQMLQRVYETGEAVVGREVVAKLERPEGGTKELYLSFVYSPLRAPTGQVDGILVIAFDVTEQVRARQQVDELRGAAEAANRAKDEFFAVLGHELRNPLAPILTALQLMRLRGTSEAEQERQVIERQANHLVRLVDDLLDVSRVTRGKIELRKQRIELADAVAQAVEMALPLLEARRHELTLDVAPIGLAVDADAVRLAQAISNLITNAAKYTEPGGHVRVVGRRDGEAIVLRVIDDGIGLDPDMLPRVFEAFVQERQALDRSQGGLGLGLAIVRGIAELHGGSVSVSSGGRGQGAEFVIRLPAAPATVAAREGPSPRRASRPPVTGSGRSVLVVDDNEDAGWILAASLTRMGHQVRVAHDGPRALEMVAESPPEIALLDIGLPVMDGYELARRLRATAGLENLALVAVTGYGQSTDRERSHAAGFDFHLVKPVDLEELGKLVHAMPRTKARTAG